MKLTLTNLRSIKRNAIYEIPRMRNIKGCSREWDKHRRKGERSIHPDEIREFLKNDYTVFKYKFRNRWIINYDQLEPHLKKMAKTEMPYLFEIVKMISASKRKYSKK